MTDTSQETILAKTAKGAGWIIGWRMVTRLIGLLNTLFLLRLLVPADFGLVALAAGFGAAADSLSWFGVEEAVIREPNPTRELYDCAFTINLIRGLATATILALAAWPTAAFFADQRLFPVMSVLALGWLVTAFENIGIVDFRRDIAFEKEFLLMALPRAVSSVIAIMLAFILHNYWALVSSILLSICLRVALGYVMHPFRPRLGLRAWRQIAGFSFWSWMLGLVGLLRDRCDTFIIGRALGVGSVGVFSAGAEIGALPVTEFVSPLGRACFSSFAAARNAGAQDALAQAFLRVLSSTLLVALPAGVGISLVAAPLVNVAFGPQWTAAIPVIQVLGVALSAMTVGLIATALLNAYAVLQRMFWIQVGALAVRVPLVILLVAQAGLTGAAIGAGVATALEHLLTLAMALRRLHIGAACLLGHTWRSLFATAAMATSLAASGLGWARQSSGPAPGTAHFVTELVVVSSAGALVYGGTLLLLWLLCGRPPGAETDLIGMARRAGTRAATALRRQMGTLHPVRE